MSCRAKDCKSNKEDTNESGPFEWDIKACNKLSMVQNGSLPLGLTVEVRRGAAYVPILLRTPPVRLCFLFMYIIYGFVTPVGLGLGLGGRGGVTTLSVVIQSQLCLINCCHFNPLSQIP